METNKIALEMLKCCVGTRGRAKRGLRAHRAEQLAGGSALVLVRASMSGWWSRGLPADLPGVETFSTCWAEVAPSRASCCWGEQLSPNPKARGMTPYHWTLVINQQTNYHSQSRLLVAFLSGRLKTEKWDLVCSEYELFPTLSATRWHWRRF